MVRYNLAFINHNLCGVDHGRVLGYDNAHGRHERHFKGSVSVFPYRNYDALAQHFYEEVRKLRDTRI